MDYVQIADTGNVEYRDAWIAQVLMELRIDGKQMTLLDVGAGSSPYKKLVVSSGYIYRSQDFAGYHPSSTASGLQNAEWKYSQHDFRCDIVEIPTEAASDVVLCTEVLEHVPDPVRAFQKMASLVLEGGYLVVTVPFISLMHQSPFWFQSGLSPFWFEYWSGRVGLETRSLLVQGDYVDLMAQEVGRTLTFRRRIKGLNRIGSGAVKRLRGRLPQDVLQSGGIGTLYVGHKNRDGAAALPGANT